MIFIDIILVIAGLILFWGVMFIFAIIDSIIPLWLIIGAVGIFLAVKFLWIPMINGWRGK